MEKLTKDKSRKQVEAFFKKLNPDELNGMMTWAYQISEDKRQVLSQAVCHASFLPMNDPHWIGSMFFTSSSNKEIADRFWNWVTDKKESPWRKIIQNIEPLIGSNGLKSGWILPGDVLRNNPFNLVKNFAIGTRGLSEHPGGFRFWDKLVRSGMNPADAFFFCSYYNLDNKDVISHNESRIQGYHWPLTEGQFNIHTFRNGEYKLQRNQYGINIGWKHPRSTSILGLPKVGKKIKTRFSEYYSLHIDMIFDCHKKWVKEL